MIDRKDLVETAKACKNSLEYFANFFFPHLLTKKVAQFHKEIYVDLLDNEFYACAAPRGHAKSTIGLIINPIHYALFRAIGDISLLSKSESFIINEIARPIKREFEQNEKLRLYFGNMKTPKWSETYFVVNNPLLGKEVAFEGGGIEGQLRGGRRGLIALDDLEDNETVESEEQRNKLRNRIYKELIPKLLPGGQMTLFGTVIHPLCFLKQVLDVPNNGWTKKIYRAYKDSVQKPENVLWGDMYSHEWLQTKKSQIGTNAFASEYLNEPMSDETSPIKDEHIRYWTELPSQINTVIAVDPAYSEDPARDFKVCVVVGVDHQMNRYLLSYIRTHQPSGEFIDGILNCYLQHKNNLTALGVPAGGTEREFYKSVVNKSTERKLYPPFVELKNTYTTASGEAKRNKKARIVASLQPLFEAGKYFISPSHVEAREELLTIGASRWDDLVDALSYAEQLITPTYYEKEAVQGKTTLQLGKSADYGIEY